MPRPTSGQDERVALTPQTSPDDFRDFYWLKSELQAFCRAHGLSPSGAKAEIADRIAHFLATGERRAPRRRRQAGPAPEINRLSAQEMTMESRAPAGFRCTQEARAFFEANVSPTFRFTVTLQRFIRSNPGVTFADIAAEWRREQEARKKGTFKPEIEPQFEFNQFTRDFHADPANAGKTREDCLEAWRRVRARRGDNRYRPDPDG